MFSVHGNFGNAYREDQKRLLTLIPLCRLGSILILLMSLGCAATSKIPSGSKPAVQKARPPVKAPQGSYVIETKYFEPFEKSPGRVALNFSHHSKSVELGSLAIQPVSTFFGAVQASQPDNTLAKTIKNNLAVALD